MTPDEILSKIKGKFPKADKASVEVKGYATVKIAPEDIAPLADWLKSQGFDYLDIVTAVDYSGPVNEKGYITDPNPNVFAPNGVESQFDPPVKTPNYPYRDAFEVVYCFSSLKERAKIFLKVELPRAKATVASIAKTFKAADWQERETYDLFGIEFEGHPNLTKILTPDFMQGYPLRKDFEHVKDKFD